MYRARAQLFHKVYDGTNTSSCFGFSISSAGDYNQDGYDDIVIGDPCYNNKQGRVWIFSGNGFGVLQSITGPNSSSEFGFKVASNTTTEPFVYITSRIDNAVYAYVVHQTRRFLL